MKTIAVRIFLVVTLLTLTGEFDLAAQNAPQLGFKRFDQEKRFATMAYWTPERLLNAIPRDLLQAGQSAAPGNLEAPTVGEPLVSAPGQLPAFESAAPHARVTGNNEPAVHIADIGILGYAYPYPFTLYSVLGLLYNETIPPVYPYSAIGKLFFTIPGQGDFVCSASTSRPHLVLTARHCVFDTGTQTFATNVMFFPGWHSGSNLTLGGGWPARILATWTGGNPGGICGGGGCQYDIGYIQTFDNDGVGCGGSAGGAPIENYTGFLGFLYGGDYSSRHWDEFGYPAAAPFDGTIQIESESSTGAEDQFGNTDTVEVGSSLTGGSSGGPWIQNFAPGVAGPVNFANGVNSFKFFARPDAINSPKFFDYNYNQLRIFSEGLACP